MEIKLSKLKTILLGIFIILASTLLNKIYYLNDCVFSKAEVVHVYRFSYIKFQYNNTIIQVKNDYASLYDKGEIVTIYYPKSEVKSANIMGFNSFWFPAILGVVAPLLVFLAFALSYIKPEDYFVLIFERWRVKLEFVKHKRKSYSSFIK
jgi:4-amino-4-deoxy-L-arabinose transferase-like glycosyltransferase